MTTPDPFKAVTEVFFTKVNPEKIEEFREWISRIHQAESKFKGFIGMHVQAPTVSQKDWVTFLQFDTLENLENWLESDQRRALLEESKELIISLERHRMDSPYEGWFSRKETSPAVWKQTMIILLVLFPVVVLELRYLSPLLTGLNQVLATFIGNAISVSLVSWPLIPIAIFFLGWWFDSKDWKINIKGAAIVCCLYLLEIFFLWSFI